LANLFIDLPVPLANGAGASVAVDAMGRVKTVTYVGDLFASVQVQVSADDINWHTLHTFPATTQAIGTQAIKKTFKVAANFMRAFVSNFRSGTAANMDVGANDDGSLFETPIAPAGNGAGAAVSVALLGTFNTVFVSDVFTGAAIIEVSDDGVNWTPTLSFNTNGGIKSKSFVAQFVRVFRNNVDLTAPGLPVVTIVAINDANVTLALVTTVDSNCLVYRPGSGLTGPVIFDTWASLIAELTVLRVSANGGGCYQIAFDDSLVSPAVVPAGAYDMTDVEWIATQPTPGGGGAGVAVSVVEGVTFTGLRTFSGPLAVSNLATATVPNTDLADGDQITVRDGADLTSTGGVAFYAGVGLVATDLVTVVLTEQGTFGGGGTGIVFALTVVGTSVLLFQGRNSGANPGTLSSIAGSFIVIGIESTSSFLGLPQAAVLGTLSFTVTDRWQLDVPAVRVGAGTIDSNELNRLDSSGGGFTATLEPISAAVFSTRGKWVIVKDVGGTAGALVAPGGGDTIDGVAASVALPANGSLLFVSDGVSNWSMIGSAAVVTTIDSNCLVYRPGSGLTGPVVFGLWADLITELTALRAAGNASGCYQIAFDDSVTSPASIPAGAYDMTNVEWLALQPPGAAGAVAVSVVEGVTFTGLRTFSGPLAVTNLATATVPNTDLADGDEVVVRQGADLTSTGGVPFYSASGLIATDAISVVLTEQGTFGGGGAGIVFAMPVAATSLSLELGRNSGPNPGTLSSIVASTITVGIGSTSAFLGFTQAALLGTLAFSVTDRWQLDIPAVRVGAGTISSNELNQLDSSGGGFTATLESINAATIDTRGTWAIVKDVGGTAGALVAPGGGDTIDGVAASVALPANGSLLFVSDGASNWNIVGQFDPSVVSGANPNCLVFQPGGTAIANVFTSWTALIAVLGTIQGCKTILFDDTFATPTIPAGAYDVTDALFLGPVRQPQSLTNVIISDGVTFTGFREAKQLSFDVRVTAPAITDLGVTDQILLDNVEMFSSTSTAEFIEVQAATAPELQLLNRCELVGGGNFELVEVLATGTLRVFMSDGCQVGDDVVRGAGDVDATFNVDSADFDPSQANLGGTLAFIQANEPRYFVSATIAIADPTPAPNTLQRVDPSAGAFSVTLPTVTLNNRGKRILVSEVGGSSNTVTMAPTGGNTIIGATTIAQAFGSRLYVSDGASSWIEISLGADKYSPPEKWDQQNVAASQTDVDLTALVSTSFDTIKMIRAGSIVGLSTRFTAAITDATADSAVVSVTINGAAGTLELSHSSGVNPSGGEATQGPGIDTFVAGDLIGIQITTLGTFAPTTTDIEAWLEVETA
jgi:hypothetical protein